MTKIIALFNQSGGVGKTSLTMNLGYQLAQRDLKVLLVDMDPQSSLTSFLGLDIYQLDKTIYQSITQYESLPIHHNIHGMDLVPSNIQLSAAEMELVLAEFREVRLKDAIATVQEQYDFILIDCPPSLAILSYISLIAATHVLVPIQTHYKSLVGCNLLLETLLVSVKGLTVTLKLQALFQLCTKDKPCKQKLALVLFRPNYHQLLSSILPSQGRSPFLTRLKCMNL